MSTGPLDPALDPDRYTPDGAEQAPTAGRGQSLPDLLGAAGTHEGERDNYQWALGLLAVFAFLGLVALLFTYVLTP